MAQLQKFNNKFVLDYDQLTADQALQHKLLHHTAEVKFHLRCMLAAHDNENKLRYLPHPQMYLKHITDGDVVSFLNRIRNSVDSFVDDVVKTIQQVKLLTFSVLTCDLKLTSVSHHFSGATVYVAECSPEKEQHFNSLPGPVTYLMHRTTPQCLYSICRNGIKSMSLESGGFRTHGACQGNGIYLASPGACVHHTNVILCYAAKNAQPYSNGTYLAYYSNIYVLQEAQICLRAVAWDTTNQANYDLDTKIVECVKQHYKVV